MANSSRSLIDGILYGVCKSLGVPDTQFKIVSYMDVDGYQLVCNRCGSKRTIVGPITYEFLLEFVMANTACSVASTGVSFNFMQMAANNAKTVGVPLNQFAFLQNEDTGLLQIACNRCDTVGKIKVFSSGQYRSNFDVMRDVEIFFGKHKRCSRDGSATLSEERPVKSKSETAQAEVVNLKPRRQIDL